VTGIALHGELTGIELVARLRADARTKHKPIIVLTASAWRVGQERAQEAGCDLFVPKPCLVLRNYYGQHEWTTRK